MPAHKKPRVLPDVKACEHCSTAFKRPARYADAFWSQKRFCSPSCASSWNNLHRQRPTADERFWAAVDQAPGQGPSGDCWEWQLGRVASGYGRLSVGTGEVRAHRHAFALAFGEAPADLFVCHSCDHPPCCNPAHLFLGTHDDNMADMASKGRSLQGRRHPKSKLTDDEVRAIRADPRMQIEIAPAYGVTQGLVGMIKRGELWKHVA